MWIAAGERSANAWEKQLCRHRGQWKGRGRRCSRYLLQPMMKTMVRQAVPCNPWRSMVEQISTHSPWRTPGWSRWVRPKEAVTPGGPMLEQAPGRACGPVERGTHSREGLLSGLVTPWDTHGGAACSWRSAPLGRDPCWSRGKVSGVLLLRRKEQQRQCVTNWLQPPFPFTLHHWTGEEVVNMGVKLNSGRREEWGKAVFEICFYFSWHNSDLIGNKLN